MDFAYVAPRPVELVDALVLESTASGYFKNIPAFWTFGDNRAFGGYTAALALAAAAKAAGMPALRSSQVLYLAATRAGPASITVEVMGAGRSAAMARAVVSQNGKPTLTAQTLMSAEVLSTGAAEAALTPAPMSCPPLRFRAEAMPFMGCFEERTVDYPCDEVSFHSGPPGIDLWVRPAEIRTGTPELHSQLFDLMALDLHLLDATRRARTGALGTTASLDFAVMWHAAVPMGEWRRVNTESEAPTGGFAATRGLLRDAHGNAYARAMQQGRMRMRPNATH